MAGEAAETKEEVVSGDENPVSSGDVEGPNTGTGEEIEKKDISLRLRPGAETMAQGTETIL